MDKFVVDGLRVGEMGRRGQMGREFWALGRLGIERGNGRVGGVNFGGVRENPGRIVEDSDWGLEFSGRDGRVWRVSGRQRT